MHNAMRRHDYAHTQRPPKLKLTRQLTPEYEGVLTSGALCFVKALEVRFGQRRRELLAARTARQAQFDAGACPDFLPETAGIRDGHWKVAPIPQALRDRRVEITGPVDRKMVINALNSGAKVFMADFEDATSPTWSNLMDGQINLKDYSRGALSHSDAKSGRHYVLKDKTAILIVRPRGWHLEEAHLLLDGRPISASLFDFGLHLFHSGARLAEKGVGPFYYLPKMESHLEARLWNDVFVFAQEQLGLAQGTIKATVLIETLPAAFEMDEILFELRDHIAGLNCGRWDYIFSFIKCFRNRPEFMLPDRARVGMGEAFLNAYSQLLIKTCHRRGAHAMGGMAAQIPIKGDKAANDAAFNRVRADKEREVRAGHDGTWVAHPGLVPVAMAVFNQEMPGPNQLDRRREDLDIRQADLLQVHQGDITEDGIRTNIRVGIQYIEAWLGGRGAVPLYHLMEDAATAEISRAQLWQWLRHSAKLADGRMIDEALIRRLMADEIEQLKTTLGKGRFYGGHFITAIDLFETVTFDDEFADFLTLPAYRQLLTQGE